MRGADYQLGGRVHACGGEVILMDVTPMMFCIVCPLMFLAGTVDAIGGGGGIISLPALLLAGVPIHAAIATNKFAAMCGTTIATVRLLRQVPVHLRLVIPAVLCAWAGSTAGAHLSLYISEQMLTQIMLVVLPVCAFVVLRKKTFASEGQAAAGVDRRTLLVACVAALIVGAYDGLYGPGTGTFLILAFTLLAHMDLRSANANTKVINLTTNVSALLVFLLNGQVWFSLGAAAAVCNMLGGYIGAGLMLKRGAAIVRPSIIIVLVLLLVKILFE